MGADKALSVVILDKTIRAARARKSEKSGILTSPALDGEGLIPDHMLALLGSNAYPSHIIDPLSGACR